MKYLISKIFLLTIYMGYSNELKSGEKSDSESFTEIILENGVTDFTINANSLDSENITDNIIDSTENVTEISVSEEDITEMLNVSTTTTFLSTSTPEPEKEFKFLTKHHKNYQSNICQCDLTKESCDVNCCCDLDCNDFDKQIFTECKNEILLPESPKLEYCYSNNLLYKEDSPWLIDKKPNSLFCVLKDNLPPILKSDYYKIYKSSKEFENTANKHFKWNEKYEIIDESFDASKTYNYNDDVWIINNSSLQIFKFPSSGISIYCSQVKRIKYMVNQKSFCMKKSNESNIFKLFENYENMYLISSPVALNETWIPNVKECPANVCIPFMAFTCDLKECKILNKTEFKFESSIFPTSVKYEFFANGSMGYTQIKIYFSFSMLPQTTKYIEEHHEVLNFWIPKNNSKHAQPLSGNPDYFNSMPIISSKLTKVKIGNTTEMEETFDFFISENLYPLKNILYIPKNVGGKCVLSNITFDTIKFKENIRTHCNVNYKFELKPESVLNATNLCSDVQNKLYSLYSLEYISENSSKSYVSVIGNPSKSFKDWIQIIEDKTAHVIIGSLKDNNTLICNNLVNSFFYRFVYAYVDQPNLKIKTVKLLGTEIKHEISDYINMRIENNTLQLRLYIKTMFYDVTVPQNVEYAKGPQFHINLPNDFFYPFSYNSSRIIFSKNTLSFQILCVMIMFYIFQ